MSKFVMKVNCFVSSVTIPQRDVPRDRSRARTYIHYMYMLWPIYFLRFDYTFSILDPDSCVNSDDIQRVAKMPTCNVTPLL